MNLRTLKPPFASLSDAERAANIESARANLLLRCTLNAKETREAERLGDEWFDDTTFDTDGLAKARAVRKSRKKKVLTPPPASDTYIAELASVLGGAELTEALVAALAAKGIKL